jgi:[ribosomal protein S5]-alanine N-acetyltransferase
VERTGERVLLREFAARDVDALLAVHADPRVMRYYDPEVGTREHAGALVTMSIDWANESPRLNFQLAIIDPASSRLVVGQGLAQEAARLILHFCFAELALQTIRGVTLAENDGVTRFVTRLGFTPGAPRPGDAWTASRGWSARDWSMTREAWEKAVLKP